MCEPEFTENEKCEQNTHSKTGAIQSKRLETKENHTNTVYFIVLTGLAV